MDQQHVSTLLQTIEDDCRYTSRYTGIQTFKPEVMNALAKVPRAEFVPNQLKPWAYENNPLPIGNGQTISQPFIVALMTDLLNTGENDKILEIGTGSGYQAAILSLLVAQVYSIEIIPTLAAQAAKRLARLGFDNVKMRHGDGYRGWPEHAPFEGIIVTAAANHVPPLLKEQLKPGGRLVIPVGYPHMGQDLVLLEKDQTGRLTSRIILSVAFVPLTGEALLVQTDNPD